VEDAMKLGTMIGIAALATAMTLGGAVTSADAGKKGKNAHQGGTSGNVHIDSGVSSKNLRAVSKKLKGHQQKAVMDEIERRERKHSNKKAEKFVGDWLGGRTDIEDHIVGLGVFADGINKRNRKSGH
jgi:hypothetical protein